MFINKNKKLFNLILIPLMVIFAINLVLFVLSSFFDLQIMELFDNLLKYKFFRYFSYFFSESGYTELYIAFMLITLIVFEYICKYINDKKNWKNEYLIWSVFSILILIWFSLELLKHIHTFKEENFIYDQDNSENVLYDIKTLLSPDEYKGLIIFIMVFHFITLLSVLLYVRLVFVKKNNFYEKQYWKESLIVLFYFFIAYGLVGTLKVLMGRDYYVDMRIALEERVKLSEMNIIFDEKWVKAPEYQDWWTFNGLIGNPEKIDWSLEKLFDGNAFPSGHMAASGMVGMCFIFILNSKNDNLPENWGLTKGKIVGVYLYLLYCFMVQITFLINGEHWLSDTAFSFMWIISSIFISILLSNWVVNKVENKILFSKEKKNKIQT